MALIFIAFLWWDDNYVAMRKHKVRWSSKLQLLTCFPKAKAFEVSVFLRKTETSNGLHYKSLILNSF